MPNASTMITIERRRWRICRNLTSSQIAKVCSSLLVPLMIGVFTIVTTMSQMNLAQQQREQDLKIAKENRDKDERIEESRRTAEVKAQEDQQMHTVLAAYLKDMTELMLYRNFTLTDKLMATVVRGKTLTTLGQLDGKRKDHLVRFLYEAQMISGGQPSIDLTGADLSGVDFTNYKLNGVSFVKCNLIKAIFDETSLQGVDFQNAQLSTTSFAGSILTNVSFEEANLTNASFISAHLFNVEFYYAIVTNADFTGVRASNFIFALVYDNNTIFNEAHLDFAIFTFSTLINASFVETEFTMGNMNNAILDNANFTGASISLANFDESKLSGSIFDESFAMGASFYGSNLVATKWQGTVVDAVDFSQANLSSASITDDQIRRAVKTFDIILPDGSLGFDTNLLKNGDAEGENDTCGTNPWYVNFMIAQKYNGTRAHILGECYFTGQSDAVQATMWQRVQVPNEYSEWVRTGAAIIRIVGNCVSPFALYILSLTLTSLVE